MIVGLANDRAQVFEALHHPDCHLTAVGSEIRAWVQGGPESFANLFDPKFQLLALKLIHSIYDKKIVFLEKLKKFDLRILDSTD